MGTFEGVPPQERGAEGIAKLYLSMYCMYLSLSRNDCNFFFLPVCLSVGDLAYKQLKLPGFFRFWMNPSNPM